MQLEEFDLLEERITDLLAKFETVKKDNVSLKKDIAAKNEIINVLEKELSLLREDKNKLDSLLKDNRIASLIKNIDTAISSEHYIEPNEIKDIPKVSAEEKINTHETPTINQKQDKNIDTSKANIEPFENKIHTPKINENANSIKPSSQNDIVNVSEDEDPFSNADDSLWDKDIEKKPEEKVKMPENKESVKTEGEYEDEYLFGDDEDEFSFEEDK